MDLSEATKTVFSRIQSLDPENATKIMGFVFIQDHGEEEMIRLAFGPETVLLSLINQAKTQLGISSNTSSATPSSNPSSPSLFNNPSRPTNPFPQSSPRIVIPNNGFQMNPSSPSSPWSASRVSDHSSPSSHVSPRPAPSLSYAAVVNGISNGSSGSSYALPPSHGISNGDCTLQDQFPFLDEGSNDIDFVDPIMSLNGRSDSIPFPYGIDSGNDSRHHFHRRSVSVSDVLLGGGGGGSEDGFGWRPCVYFARGFCKNGNSCKFVHSGFTDSPESSNLNGFDELLRMKAIQQQRFAAASQLMAGGSFPYNKLMSDSPRSPSAALMMGEELHNFGRCRPEGNDFSVMGFRGSDNSCARQIYLTFPADSTFLEEDVSNYFSKFGPVQDVRIPYQQKRMFGFVSFVYPETVKIILAKGNPHFVCDSRVLVKPYKEKGKVPDKKQQQHQLERGGSFDSLEPYDLPIGPRMFLNSQEMMLRRKLEQAELELQGRRIMNLQLMELKNHHHGHHFQPNHVPGVHLHSHAQPHQINQSLLLCSNSVSQETLEENNSNLGAANSPTATADQQHKIEASYDNINGNDSANSNEKCSNPENDHHHESIESSLEHILPDSLFASPTKSAGDRQSIFSTALAEADDCTSLTTTSSSNSIPILPTTSTLNMASLKSCYLQIPRKVE